jgi:putative ABC transport system ATP-binding protein
MQTTTALDSAPNRTTSAMIVATGVRKTYRSGPVEVDALRGIDLIVDPGEFVALMGPSGAGKTTLLNCLSGLDDITAGSVAIAGEDLQTMTDARRTAHRAAQMGFVFQAFNLIPVFTAVENVELPLLLAGASSGAARQAAAATLERVGLSHRISHRPTELSGGEQQRVAVARALASRPSVVWADEPTGSLDEASAEAVMDLITELNAGGVTVMLVTHSDEVSMRARRRIVVRDGRIVTDQVLR